MHATQVNRPFHREGWVYEEKVDGWRMLAYKVGNDVRLVSRNGRDHTKRFTELADESRELDASPLILDGEVAVFDSKLMSRFEWMRQRPPAEASTPPVFIAFDCLLTDKKDIRDPPLYVRRNVLDTLLEDPNLDSLGRAAAAAVSGSYKETVERLLAEWAGLLAGTPVAGRMLLRKLLVAPIMATPDPEGGGDWECYATFAQALGGTVGTAGDNVWNVAIRRSEVADEIGDELRAVVKEQLEACRLSGSPSSPSWR